MRRMKKWKKGAWMAVVWVLAWLPVSILNARDRNNPIDQMIQQGEKAFLREQYSEALQFFVKAKKQAERVDSFRLNYVATYDMGISYFMISEHGEALNCYYEAAKIVEKHQLGAEAESKILNGIAGVYFEEKNFDKAQEICMKCYEDAILTNDSASCVTCCLDLAILGNKNRRVADTDRFLKEAKKWLAKQNDSVTLGKIDVIYAEMHFMKEEYDQVLRISERHVGGNCIPNVDRVVLMIYLIQIYKDRGMTEAAFRHAAEAMRISPLRSRPELYEVVSALYRQRGNMSMALLYKDSVIIYSDSLTRLQDHKLSENSHIKLELFKMQMEMDRELSKMSMHRQAAVLTAIICLLLIVIGLIVYRSKRQQARQREQMMRLQIEKEKNEKLLAEKRTRETELIAHYQEEIMKKEIEQKKNELATTTMLVVSRNALIADLLSEITALDEAKTSPQLAALAGHLKQLLKNGNEHDNFLVSFEAANPDFAKVIRQRHPGLSTSDIRFLSYVRMNLSLKEIAAFLNVEPESCKRRKIRLSKKLGLESSSDLYQYVSSL